MSSARDRLILVVDDDEKIVALVRLYLEREGYRVVAAHDGASALRQIDQAPPSLLILDVMLPELDGLSVLRAVRDRGDLPVIMLSARSTAGDRIAGLGIGADDYVTKPFSPAELVLRVRRVLARSAGPVTTHPNQLARGDLALDLHRQEASVDGSRVSLTPVEARILAALMAAEGRILTRQHLLDAAYGHDAAEVLERTVDVHVGRLRDKLGDTRGAPRFIATVRGSGYRVV